MIQHPFPREKHPILKFTKTEGDQCTGKNKLITDDVYFITIAGSMLTDLYDEGSDIDLVIWTAQGTEVQYDSECYNGIHVHGYYHILPISFPLSSIQCANRGALLQLLGLQPEHFLYVKSGYEQLPYIWLNNIKPFIGELGLLTMGSGTDNYQLLLRLQNDLLSKSLVGYSIAYHYLNNIPGENEYFKRLRRSRYLGLTPQDREQIVQEVSGLIEHYDEQDTEKEKEEMLQQVQKVGQDSVYPIYGELK